MSKTVGENITLYINRQARPVWKMARHRCRQRNTTISEYITGLLKRNTGPLRSTLRPARRKKKNGR